MLSGIGFGLFILRFIRNAPFIRIKQLLIDERTLFKIKLYSCSFFTIFGPVEKLRFHLVFWSCYLLQFCVFEFIWAKGAYPDIALGNLSLRVFLTSFLYLFPQMAFAYSLSFLLNRILRNEGRLFLQVAGILAALFVCIVIDRLLINYIILPHIYQNPMAIKPILDPQKIPIIIVYLGYSSGLMIIIRTIRDQLAAKEREKNLIKEKLETELKFLRNQTNPHFLFNTLNNIYALARKKSDKAPEAIMKLSELLGFMLYEYGKNAIYVTEEIKMIQDYIDLQQIRYSERLKVNFHTGIDDTSQQIAPLLLLPLVENAFKYGVSETRFSSYIHIDFMVHEGYLDFIIENSLETEPMQQEDGKIGLKNLRRQLELMYKEHNLQVQCSSTSFKVHVFINLNNYGKA